MILFAYTNKKTCKSTHETLCGVASPTYCYGLEHLMTGVNKKTLYLRSNVYNMFYIYNHMMQRILYIQSHDIQCILYIQSHDIQQRILYIQSHDIQQRILYIQSHDMQHVLFLQLYNIPVQYLCLLYKDVFF